MLLHNRQVLQCLHLFRSLHYLNLWRYCHFWIYWISSSKTSVRSEMDNYLRLTSTSWFTRKRTWPKVRLKVSEQKYEVANHREKSWEELFSSCVSKGLLTTKLLPFNDFWTQPPFPTKLCSDGFNPVPCTWNTSQNGHKHLLCSVRCFPRYAQFATVTNCCMRTTLFERGCLQCTSNSSGETTGKL